MANGYGVLYCRSLLSAGACKLTGRNVMGIQELQRLLSLLSKFRSQEYGMSASGESVSLDAVVEEVERVIDELKTA